MKSPIWILLPQSAWTSDLQLAPHCTHACRTCRDNFRNLVARFLQENVLRFLSRMMCTTCGRKSTMMTQTDPEIRCGPISTIQMDGNPPSLQVITSLFPQVLMAKLAKVHNMAPDACRQIMKCGTSGCTGSCQPAVVEPGYHAGKQPRAGFVGRPTRNLAHPCPIHCPPVELREKRNSIQVAFPARSRHPSRVSESDSPCEESAVGVQCVQPVNDGNCNDASGPCVPSKSNRFAGSAGSCGTKLLSEEARALYELHESIPVPSVDGSGAYFVMSERLGVSAGFGGAKILET